MSKLPQLSFRALRERQERLRDSSAAAAAPPVVAPAAVELPPPLAPPSARSEIVREPVETVTPSAELAERVSAAASGTAERPASEPEHQQFAAVPVAPTEPLPAVEVPAAKVFQPRPRVIKRAPRTAPPQPVQLAIELRPDETASRKATAAVPPTELPPSARMVVVARSVTEAVPAAPVLPQSASAGAPRRFDWESLLDLWHYRRLTFVLLTLFGAAAAFAPAYVFRHKYYIATVLLSRDTALQSVPAAHPISPRAFAQTVRAPAFVAHVARLAQPPLDGATLLRSVEVDTDPRNDLVSVAVSAPSVARAIALANLFARELTPQLTKVLPASYKLLAAATADEVVEQSPWPRIALWSAVGAGAGWLLALLVALVRGIPDDWE